MAIPKRFRRVAVIFAIVAGGLTLLLLGIAHLPVVRAHVLERVREYAARELGVGIDAKSLHYNLLGPSAELRDVALRSVDDKGRRALLHADSLRLALGRGIVFGRVEVTRLELVRPRITIVRHADGTLNLPRGRGAASRDVTPLRLGLVDIRQLTVGVEDEMSARSFAMGPVDLSIDTSSATPVPGAFGPSPFSISFEAQDPGEPTAGTDGRARPTTLSGTVAGRLAFDGTRLLVPALTIEAPEGRLALEGSIDVISPAPRVDVRARARVDLARAARLAGLDRERISGTLNATGQATGLMSAPAVQVGLEGSGLAVRIFENITLAAASTIDKGRLVVSAIDVRSPLGVVHAKGDVALVGTGAGAGAASHLVARWIDVDLDAAIGSLGYALPTRLGSRGSGTADLRLAGVPGPAWFSGLDADVSSALRPIGGGLSLAGTVDVGVRHGAWSLEHRLVSAPAGASLDGSMRGRLDARTNDSSIGGGARLRVDDLRAVYAFAQAAGAALPEQLAEDLRGHLAADLRVNGTAARPAVDVTLRARDVHAAGVGAGTVDAALKATREALRIETVAVRLGPTRLQASGSYAWGGHGDVRFEAQASDLAVLARTFESPVPVAGSAQIEGRAWGTVASPRVDATLDAQHLSIDGTDVGPARATFALAGNRLRVEASAPALAVVARGDLDTLAPYAYQAEVRLDRATLPALVPVRLREQVPISDGTIAGTLHAKGTLQRPMPVSADANLDALDAVIDGTRVVLESPAAIAWSSDRLTVTGVSLRVGRGAHARLSGSLGAEPTSDPLRIAAEGPLSELVALAGSRLPADASLSTDGTFAVDVAVGGTLPAPLPVGTVSVRAAMVAYGDLPPATDLVVDARVEPARIVLRSLGAAWQQARVSADAIVPLRLIARAMADADGTDAADGWAARWLASLPPEPARAALSARVTGITPTVLEPFAGADALREVDGTMALTITADAAALSIEHTRATAVLDEASLTLAGVPFRQAVPTRFRLENGELRIEELRWDSLGNPLVVAGRVNVAAAPRRVDVKVNGTLDLRALGAFASGVATSGTARADVAIGGSIESPELAGEIVVADGEARVDSPRLVLSDLAGSIRIAKDRAAVLGLTGTINGGAARLGGNLDLTRPDDPRGLITLTAEDVAFEYPDGLQTESNVRLSLALAARPLLSGRIDVLGGTYREPLVLTGRLLEGLRQSGIATAARPPDFLSTLGLDLTLATAEGIRIDNNYGRLDIAGTLRITGTPERPGLIGRIEAAPDGEVFLAGNTYRVERLVLDFSNPRAIAPDLSFLAQTRVGGVPIEVELLCPADGPCERHVKSLSAELTTDAEAEAQLFGMPADAAAAGEQLARLLSGEVLGLVSRTVRLDTLRLEQGTRGRSDIFDDPTLVAGDVDPASRLTLGKRLGDRVELAFSQNLTESGFTWSTTYRGPYGLSVRALLLDDQSRSVRVPARAPLRRVARGAAAAATRAARDRRADLRNAGLPGT